MQSPLDFSNMTRQISYQITKQGQVNFPGASAASKKVAEELLRKDADDHHCFFRPAGLHNHTSHQILAAYDLGAPPALLQKIYDHDAKVQRPIALGQEDKELVVDKSNWTEYLGKTHHVYNAYFEFFKGEVSKHGISASLEKYVFHENANTDGREMVIRVCSSALHPFIQIGYGAEFGLESLVATGLALACTTPVNQSTLTSIDKTSPGESISLLELLRRVYDSDVLTPPPFDPYPSLDPAAMFNQRIKDALGNGGREELQKLCSLYHISNSITNEDLNKKVDEIMWVSTLLLAGTGRKGRKPRLDFFLMHFVTSSLFIRPFLEYVPEQEHKASFLRTFVFFMMTLVLARGRPKVDAGLAMSYPAVVRAPSPPGKGIKPSAGSLGSPLEDQDFNPWGEIIQGGYHHPELHLLKAIRSLAYFSIHLGTTSLGCVPGAWRDAEGQVETHPGIGQVDGTLFVRTAGNILNTLGWCGHGQEQTMWNYSALGWDEAWNNED